MSIDKEIKIPGSFLSIGKEEVFIIAEIGKNFIQTEEDKSIDEYLANAKELVRLAKESGADAVKFQTHSLEDEQLGVNVVSPHFKGADRYFWVKRNTEATPLEFWQEIKKYCDEIGILFFSTPMSRGAAQKLNQAGVNLWKVGSGDILDFATLDYMAGTGKPIILSSGMSTLEELDKSVNFLRKRNALVALLHCVSKYPCPPKELKIETVNFLEKRYKLPTGFSDHSIEITSTLVAVSMDAKIIEKHFSLDRNLWGADHKVSLNPREFKEMSASIRRIENNFILKEKIARTYKNNFTDVGTKSLQDDEAVFRPYFRKSLMAGKNILAGERITADMLYAMRPQAYAGGLPSEEYENIIGKITRKNLKKYDPVTWDAIA